MKVVFVDLDRCFGCRSCEQVCAFQGIGDFKCERSNIWVLTSPAERAIFTLTCQQCENAVCIESCPTGALGRDPETNAVVVDTSICVGCKQCVMSCPFGSIHFDPEKRVVHKCDLCKGDPKCVQYCLAEALYYGDLDELLEMKRKDRHKNLALHALPRRGGEQE
jgi:Fe-S-cluster-containing dehydrogenase component